MEYRIHINLDGDAFQAGGDMNPDEAAAVEVGRLLDELAEHINKAAQLRVGALKDSNGNRCGSAWVIGGRL